jgi:hypothetical protein
MKTGGIVPGAASVGGMVPERKWETKGPHWGKTWGGRPWLLGGLEGPWVCFAPWPSHADCLVPMKNAVCCQTGMDRPIRCPSLIQECEEH